MQERLLDPSEYDADKPLVEQPAPSGRVVRVLPDVSGIARSFDYVVPDDAKHGDLVAVGTMVRVVLHGRRVNGWIMAVDVEPPPGITLQPIVKVRSLGPDEPLCELARWAAWRWAGRVQPVLGTASPQTMVTSVPAAPKVGTVGGPQVAGLAKVFEKPLSVVRLSPSTDVYPLLFEATQRGNALIIATSHRQARSLGMRLRRGGVNVAFLPDDWAKAKAGATVIGPRSAVWAPVVGLGAIVVLDEHEEAHQEERTPTWNARDVAIERAARAGVPCALVSPVPSLEALALAPVLKPSRSAERNGWPVLVVIDRHDDDPTRGGLLSAALTDVLRSPGRIVCVLNRKGRSRRLACASCGELAWHEPCSAAMQQLDDDVLVCPSCDERRPVICTNCGAGRFKNLRAGITRVREELEALARRPVQEVSGDDQTEIGDAEVIVGTEAALHRVDSAAAVVFLDIDQELLAPRYRAAEETMALLARAARLVGSRGEGRLVVQTRMPGHRVLDAVFHADPSRLVVAERAQRELLLWPPCSALAEISGANAAAYVEQLHDTDVTLLGPNEGRWLVRAPTASALADALATVKHPGGRVRVAVDARRV